MSDSRNYFIELGGVTAAHRAQSILESNSIKSRTGKISTPSGCSWGVYVEMRKKDEAALLLRASSVKIL